MHNTRAVRTWALRFVMTCAVVVCLIGTDTQARDEAAAGWTAPDAAALREMLEGSAGRREVWRSAPELVILTSVMEFTGPDMTAGYAATGETITVDEIEQIEADFTSAIASLTARRFAAFSAVYVEPVAAGQVATMFRRGQVVVGRFRGVHDKAGTLGFGGRTTREGAITAGAVILDSDFDRKSDRRGLLRTHELGHALGYNHVESRRSVMNPRVGSDLTDFDRTAIEFAFTNQPPAPARVQAGRQARLQN